MPEPIPSPLRDLLGRPLRSLRVSVTDRCNLRCLYCMPEEDYVWLPREELLSFEELAQVVEVFTELGVDHVRLTGGEPLLRRDLNRLVRMLAANARIKDLALTTNGVLLAEQAEALRRAGLHRVTISLDTLRPERFSEMTRRGAEDHARVLAGFSAARQAGFPVIKLDAVIVRGVNDDELGDLIEFGRAGGSTMEVRFIEYMDVAGATRWAADRVFSRDEMLARIERRFGKITPVIADSSAPASRYVLPDGTVFGIIASTTAPFCRQCDRSRLTADGMWYRCLYATAGADFRSLLRTLPQNPSRNALPGALASPASVTASATARLSEAIRSGWLARSDRGAEQRKAERFRGAFVLLDELRKDPHLEMHTRGG